MMRELAPELRRAGRTVLQIVPFRSARNDGIGDYARVVAQGLQRRHGIDTIFLSGTPADVHPAPDDGWRTRYVSERSGAALAAALKEIEAEQPGAPVILHVGGYGYARRGAPIWLLQGLRHWRVEGATQCLLGIFHELYAKGRPWQSSFWLGPVQKFVARGIWSLADCGITTNTRYRDTLCQWRPEAADRIRLMPVPSSIGEPTSVPRLASRPSQAMVFGAAGVERAVYGTHAAAFGAMLERLGIARVVDVGSRHMPPPARLGPARVDVLGRLSADEVSRIMLECRLGLMSYDTTRLGKSTVFASFAAHGVLPVCIGFSSAPTDGLEAGRHFVIPCLVRLPRSVDELTDMQRHLTHWYAGHSASALARTIARLLDGDNDVALGDAPGKKTTRPGRHPHNRTHLPLSGSPIR